MCHILNHLNFLKSGNYIILIYDENMNPIITKRFIVYEEIVKIESVLKRGTFVKDFDTKHEIDFKIHLNNLRPICQGCNARVVELSTYSIEDLAKDNSADFQMHVKVPPSALDTDSAVMGVTAVSRDDSSATATVESTTTVKTVYNSEITTDDSYRLLNPGEETSFNVTVKNMGNSQESFTVRLDSNAPNWNFGNKLPHYTSDLGSYGGSETFVLPVEIPMNTNPGYYNFSINLILDSDGLKVGTLQLSVLIEYSIPHHFYPQ